MLYIADNLKHLRARNNETQSRTAEGMGIPRDRYRKYEDGTNTPPAEMLVVMSRYYHLSIDVLLMVNLRKHPAEDLLRLDDNRLLFPISVDANGDNRIEIVTQKAKAGYLSGYADPDYIESLQHISLPFLGPGKHRGFPVDGDSMPPHENGSTIIGKYIERLGDVIDGRTYLLVTKNEGMVYKRLNKNKKNTLVVESDNRFFPAYEVKISDIIEIWEYVCSIGRSDKKREETESESVRNMFLELKREIAAMRK